MDGVVPVTEQMAEHSILVSLTIINELHLHQRLLARPYGLTNQHLSSAHVACYLHSLTTHRCVHSYEAIVCTLLSSYGSYTPARHVDMKINMRKMALNLVSADANQSEEICLSCTLPNEKLTY